jgi:hypothetical protein
LEQVVATGETALPLWELLFAHSDDECMLRRFRKLSVLLPCYFFTSAYDGVGCRGMELLWPQSLARAGNCGLAARSQDFANEEKVGQQGAEMARCVQVIDELRADRRLD